MHVDVRGVRGGPDLGSQINWWVRRIYLVLIAGTVGGMLIHNGLLFWRKLSRRLRSAERTVLRMDRVQRWQHGLLAGSFAVLALTGFSLSYPDSWLAYLLGNSEPLRRWLHRGAAVVLLLTSLWHLVYAFVSPAGKQLWLDLLPRARDFRDLLETMAYLLGRRPRRPPVGRFGYTEKFEYWAVVWGTVVMGGSPASSSGSNWRSPGWGSRGGSWMWPLPFTSTRRSWRVWPLSSGIFTTSFLTRMSTP